MALLVANNAVSGIKKDLPIVFSSRHGDLPKTSTLLADLADKNALSPTAFGLSVHNAIPSLFSILAKKMSLKKFFQFRGYSTRSL